MSKKFVNIHGHTHFSLLDGMTRVNELIDRTLEIDQPASCITDHGVMYSIVDHFQYAESKQQKPIAGFEAYVVKNHTLKGKDEIQTETDNKREHMVLLAMNNDGYKRITKMCSIGTTEGFYYRPRIDDKVMESVGTEGVLATSACLAGRIPQCLMKDDMENAEKWAQYYYKLFNGNFYLEIQPTIEPSQVKVNLGIIEIHKKLGIPIVATTDFHYLNKEDANTHEVLLAMQSRSLMSDPKRWKFPGDTYYVMTRDEILNSFKKNGHEKLDQSVVEEAVNTSVDIAEKCNVSFEWGKHYLPKIQMPEDDKIYNKKIEIAKNKNPEFEPDSGTFLRHICQEGLKNKHKTEKKYLERLNYELDVINNMGFPDYFLIVWDIMKYCKENDIPVGPGRGCFSPDNFVTLSNNNKIKITDVKIGDKVISHDEKEHKVTDVLQYYCDEILTSLELEDKQIKCTKDHKIFAIKKEDFDKGIREPKWYQSDELVEGDYVCELD